MTQQIDPPPILPGPVGLRYTLRDHRGAVVLLAPASWGDRVRVLSRAGRLVSPLSGTMSTAGLLVLVMISVTALQEAGSRMAATLTGPGSWDVAVQAIGLFGPLAVLLIVSAASVLFTAARVWMPGVARAWLSEGRCPSCRYPIDTLDAEADGCTVCPECGSAWRVWREPAKAPGISSSG